MKKSSTFCVTILLVLTFFCGSTFALEVYLTDYSYLTGTELITFDDAVGGPDPGVNYDGLFESGNTTFGEHFLGQSVNYNGDFDEISGTPAGGGLTLQTGAPGENLAITEFNGTQVLTGLGNIGHPDFDAIGEGAFSLLFDFDQSEFGFQLIGGNGGSATIDFFARNGSLIDSLTLHYLADSYYGFYTEDYSNVIAGISVDNLDPWGIGIDNIRHDVAGIPDGHAPVPEPSTFLLLGSGLAGLAWFRRKSKNA